MAEELGLEAQLSDGLESEDYSQQFGDTDSDDVGTETDSEDDEGEGQRGANVANIFMGALHPHVVGWPLGNRHRPLDSNEGLVDHLLKTGAVNTPAVAQAMRICPRDQFIPGGARNHPDVFADSPVHVTNKGFNISAPHMHATCLQALDLKPGLKVLDIGSGSGLLSAYAAMLVGKTGSVLGVDCLRPATQLAKQNIRRLARSSRAFSERAAPCTFRTHNIFMPAADFQGRFDRIVAGASCPQNKVRCLASLLKPSGGVIVSPIIPSELHRIVKLPDGSCTLKVISQVRFSNLELPRDVKILKALVDLDRNSALKPPASNSTFVSDVSSISGSLSSPMASSSLGSDRTAFARSASAETPKSTSWRRMTKLFTACSSGSERSSPDGSSADGFDSPQAALNLDDLGAFDCTLIGSGWCLQAHKRALPSQSSPCLPMDSCGKMLASLSEYTSPNAISQKGL